MVYINVLELSVELRIAFSQELNRLHIVAVNYLLLFGIKSDFFEETLPLN